MNPKVPNPTQTQPKPDNVLLDETVGIEFKGFEFGDIQLNQSGIGNESVGSKSNDVALNESSDVALNASSIS